VARRRTNHHVVAPAIGSAVGSAVGSTRGSETLRETAARLLRRRGQRLTDGRRRLLEALSRADRPLTIPEILGLDPAFAQSSVYRNLVVLEQAGVVHRVITHDEFARYELAEDLTGHHHHLVCSSCGRVEDLPASASLERSVATAISQAARSSGFHVERHRLDLVGRCAHCT
jgi:Fe2+ or Zn2+ uptake regulation protein